MASYQAAGVYIKDIVSGSQSISQESSSIGALIGITSSGVIGVAKKIGSFTEYIAEFSNGLETPFLENDYLSYAVHGFFANGGKELYVVSLKKNGVKATKTSTGGITATTLTEGAWGNKLKVAVKKSAGYAQGTNEIFDITISLGTSDSVTIKEVTKDNASNTIMTNNKLNKWLGVFNVTDLVEETFTLETGSDGTQLQDSDYIKSLETLDVLDDVTMVSVVGQTSTAINDALIAYCDNKGLFPILDMPRGSSVEDTKNYRKKISAWTGALCYPWGKINDPLTNTLKAVPCAGHVMGVYARVIENRGIHKAPAGVDAVVRGFIEMETSLTPSQLSTLNPVGVVCIMSRPNAGIVIWGARSLNSTDTTMRYVTDGLLNLNIKRSLFNGTQFAVFEPNNETLWSRVQATCKSFLETLRTQGALKGTAEEAYYVTVNDTNNTNATIADGQLNIEVGYAPVKPAEFIIIKLAHNIGE